MFSKGNFRGSNISSSLPSYPDSNKPRRTGIFISWGGKVWGEFINWRSCVLTQVGVSGEVGKGWLRWLGVEVVRTKEVVR